MKKRWRKKLMNFWVDWLFPKVKDTPLYPFIYPSYWHYLFHGAEDSINANNYFTARPHPGAGIGHQMSNWHSGYWHAMQFGMKYAYSPFAQKIWDDFLGYGVNEVSVKELQAQGYKKVRLPLFEENNLKEINRVRKIISSYNRERVVFTAEQDQPYKDQYGVSTVIKQKFYAAPYRKFDKTYFQKENFNIAVHIRRGDIVIGQTNKDPNLLMRWQDNSYFYTVLRNVLEVLVVDKPIHIYLFSQGNEADFLEFKELGNIHYCLDMNPQETFLSFVYADLLITSKSSFSYKPALLNSGIKVCPKDFWHSYPDTKDWILADEKGNIPVREIKALNIE